VTGAVQIVLAAYNSAGFIDQMLASIEAQDFTDWLLIVRDDASTDGTAEKLMEWQQRIGSRMRIIPNPDKKNLGITGNFTRLLEEVTSRYFMVADGDDVWHSDKIRLSLAAIREREAEIGPDRPVLIHTDMHLIGGRGELIAESAWRYADIYPRRNYPLIEMIFNNVVCGPTIVGNRHLLDLALPIPMEAGVEDWWLALVAAAFGEVEPLGRQTMDYRRHGNNMSELPRVTLLTHLQTFMKFTSMRWRLHELLGARLPIAQAFLLRYGSVMSARDRAAVEALVRLPASSWLPKRIAIVKHRLWFNSLTVNAAYFLLV